MARFYPLCFALLVTPGLAAQSATHVVDSSGAPGTDFTDLGSAIAAARNGDVLYVRRYDINLPPLTWAWISLAGKGLTIVADEGVNRPWIDAITVTGLSVDDFVLLQGLEPSRSFSGAGTWSQNEGVLWFEDCSLHYESASTKASDCAAVVLKGCDVSQYLGTISPFLTTDSGVFVHGSRVDSWDGQFAIEARNSALELVGSQLIGHEGFVASPAFCEGVNGGSALSLTRSLARRLDSTLVAGAGFAGDDQCGPGRDGVELRVDGQSTLTDLPGFAKSYALLSPIREDESLQATLTGSPGDRVWLLASRTPGHGFAAPQLQGSILLGAPWKVAARATLPASGSLSVQLPAPRLASGEESRVYFSQAVVRDATTGHFVVSAPSALVVLDETF